MNRGNIATLVLLLVVVAMISAGCTTLTGGGEQKSLSSAPNDAMPGTNYETGIGQGTSRPVPTAVPTMAPVAPDGPDSSDHGVAIDQKLIYTAQVSLEVPDVPATIDSLKALAAGKGGYLASSTFSTQYNDRKTATVVLRVPAKEFEGMLAGVRELGIVKSATTNGEDVTAEYVDLLAQKASYQNQIAQYNEIMKKSEKVEDIIKVQEQIDRVQTSLDRLEGRIRYLNNRIDLSTITVNLAEKEPVGGNTGYSFTTTINEGISGLVGMIDFLIVALFTLLPVIIIGAAGYGVYRWQQSKKTVKGAAPPKPETPEKK
ncbi:MAG: DUF4349 domain-containing protein [Methanomicrobiales archaeon]